MLLKSDKKENAMEVGKEPEGIRSGDILNGLDSSIILIDDRSNIVYLNSSAEQFFAASQTQLAGRNIDQLLPIDSALMSLIKQVQIEGSGVSDYGVLLDTPRTEKQLINIIII